MNIHRIIKIPTPLPRSSTSSTHVTSHFADRHLAQNTPKTTPIITRTTKTITNAKSEGKKLKTTSLHEEKFN